MYKILYLKIVLIIVLTIFSCKKPNNVDEEYPKVPQDSTISETERIQPQKTNEEILKEQAESKQVNGEIILSFTLKRAGNGFTYELFCEQEMDSIVNFKTIKIFEGKKLIQKIDVDSAYVYDRNEINFDVTEDANFDGFKDIQLINWHGMVDYTNNYYLYNTSLKKYEFSKSLAKVMNPVFDKKNNLITSDYHIGPADYYSEVYQWRKGKLVKISKE